VPQKFSQSWPLNASTLVKLKTIQFYCFFSANLDYGGATSDSAIKGIYRVVKNLGNDKK
jgi:hypothetical protein